MEKKLENIIREIVRDELNKNKTNPVLEKAWQKRLELHKEGRKAYDEGRKIFGNGDILFTEGNTCWAEAVLNTYGDIKVDFRYNQKTNKNDCYLGNGEVYYDTKE